MSETLTNNSAGSRIAKNTMVLYFRTILVMLVTLYTSRVVLKSLGVDDFGIYALVGSILGLLTMLRGSMSNCVSRFICFELGKNDKDAVVKVFNTGLYIHIIMAAIVFIVAETVGLFVLNNFLKIPEARMDAAFVVLQFSIIASVFQVLIFHFSATIVALERMSFFAFMSILTAILRLIIAFLIAYDFNLDKLEFYAFLLMLESACSFSFHVFYCSKYTNISKYRIVKDWALFKKMISFSGWLSLGNMVQIFNIHGVAIVMNSFYGVVANASMGIANQVGNSVFMFANNFQISFNPQLVKAYAQNDMEMFRQLLFISTKVIFFLVIFIAFPLILSSQYLLSLWLVIVPAYASVFLQLVLISFIFDALSIPLWRAVNATGEIKKAQIISSSIFILLLPSAYFLLDFGVAIISILILKALLTLSVGIWLVFHAKKLFEFSPKKYFKEVWLVCFLVVFLSLLAPVSVSFFFEEGFMKFFVVSLSLGLSMLLSMMYVGFNAKERRYVFNLLSNKIKFLKKFEFIIKA